MSENASDTSTVKEEIPARRVEQPYTDGGMTMPDSLPPHDPEAEAGALACVLEAKDPADLLRQLNLEHFYDLRHRTIFNVLRNLESINLHGSTVGGAQCLHYRHRPQQVCCCRM